MFDCSLSKWPLPKRELKLPEGLCRTFGNAFGRLAERVMNFQNAGRALRRAFQAVPYLVPIHRSFARPQMLVTIAIVVVQVRGAEQRLQSFDRCRFSFTDVRVAYVHAYADITKMPDVQDLHKVRGLGDFVLQVLDQQLDSQWVGKGVQVLERGQRKLERARVPGVFAFAEVQDEKPERNLLGHFQSALDF